MTGTSKGGIHSWAVTGGRFLGTCVLVLSALLVANTCIVMVETQKGAVVTLIQPVYKSRTCSNCTDDFTQKAEKTKQTFKYDDKYFAELDVRMRNAQTIVYNRVPKCGSSATVNILHSISKTKPVKPFSFYNSKIYHTEHLSANGTRILIKKLKGFHKPWIFERHLHFVDFSVYKLPMPLYINLVRNPVERCLSQYYFYRFEHRKPMSEERRNRTFDECVLKNYTECQTEATFVVTPFFCGQTEICLKPNRQALELAKKNVDKYYGVVGITEDLMGTYALMEKTMPHILPNMLRIATGHLTSLKKRYKTHKKPAPSQKALDIMASRLGIEYEFYYFVKNRYLKFLEHYNISSILNSESAVGKSKKN